MGGMESPLHSDLRVRLDELRLIDSADLAARMMLVSLCAELEDTAPTIAAELGVDDDVVLAVMRAAWMEQVERNELDADVLRVSVPAMTRRVTEAIATDSALDGPARAVIERVRADTARLVPVRRALQDAGRLITAMHAPRGGR